jgi:hypothetical protein
MQSSRPWPIHQISPGYNVDSGIASIHLMQLYQTNSLAPTTTSTLPRIRFVVFPVSIMTLLKHLIRSRLRYFSVFRSCHRSLRTNRCFDLIASEISSLKSLSPGLLCLLRHFSVGYFQHAVHHSHWYQTNDYHSVWNDYSWIFIRNPDITLLIPRDLSHLSSMPYSPITTISYDRWGN